MTKTIEAIYENGALKPLDEIQLVEHQRVRVTIQSERPAPSISQDPRVRQGRPCLASTGIEVMFIAWLRQDHGLSLEELADELNITPEQAQGALDYYSQHREEIDRFIEQHRMENKSIRSSLPTDPLILALKELSRTHRDVAKALMQLLRSGKREEVQWLLRALKHGQTA